MSSSHHAMKDLKYWFDIMNETFDKEMSQLINPAILNFYEGVICSASKEQSLWRTTSRMLFLQVENLMVRQIN